MQYFTPELCVRLQNLEDRGALQEWDRAAARYASALQQVLPQFPAPLPPLRSGSADGEPVVFVIATYGPDEAIPEVGQVEGLEYQISSLIKRMSQKKRKVAYAFGTMNWIISRGKSRKRRSAFPT